MELFAGHDALADAGRRLRASAVCIGNFDGVHLGHRRLFDETRARAAARGARSVVLTFEPHPARVLAPGFAPPLICTPARKLARIAEAGIDVCVALPFDRALAELPPERFFDEVLATALAAAEIVVGHDFTFGKARAGSTARLVELGAARGIAVTVVPAVTVAGIVCSSTKVREFVLEGRVDGAALLLGRDPEIEGVVVHGAGRGRGIGVPTANLRPETELLPAPGVYAGWAEREDGARYGAAVNLGTNPTFEAGANGDRDGARRALSVEAHLLDYPGEDLYGSRLRLGLRRRLRAEQRFPSVDTLVSQIRSDIEAARAEFSARKTASAVTP